MDRLTFKQRDIKNILINDIKVINNTLKSYINDVPFINITDHFVQRIEDRGCSHIFVGAMLERLVNSRLCEYLYLCYNDDIKTFAIQDGTYYLFVRKTLYEGCVIGLKLTTLVQKPRDYKYYDEVILEL